MSYGQLIPKLLIPELLGLNAQRHLRKTKQHCRRDMNDELKPINSILAKVFCISIYAYISAYDCLDESGQNRMAWRWRTGFKMDKDQFFKALCSDRGERDGMKVVNCFCSRVLWHWHDNSWPSIWGQQPRPTKGKVCLWGPLSFSAQARNTDQGYLQGQLPSVHQLSSE